MANPFSGLVNSEFKQIHTNAINALLESGACASSCKFIYGNTKTTSCSNCIYDAVGRKSSNRYQSGGPVPFSTGQPCPMCHGIGRIFIDAEEDNVDLCIIWDYKSWIPSITAKSINSPQNFVQTFSKLDSTLPKIKKVKDVIMDTSLDNYLQNRFSRYGEPEPCGFDHSFIITMWKRVG